MGGTLSCDACGNVVVCPQRERSPHVYTLKCAEGDQHVCERCYVDDARRYPHHVKELAFDIVQASSDANVARLAPSIERAAKRWNEYEYRACDACGAETAMRADTVACFHCKKPFASAPAPRTDGGRDVTCITCGAPYVEFTRTLNTYCGDCH